MHKNVILMTMAAQLVEGGEGEAREPLFTIMCYECGEFGHLSYACPNNLLGDREPPKKKSKKRKKEAESKANKFCKSGDTDEEVDEEEENFEDESLSAAIRYQQELREAETFQERISVGHHLKETEEKHKAKIKKSSYFSDEEELRPKGLALRPTMLEMLTTTPPEPPLLVPMRSRASSVPLMQPPC
ncbi:Zinc finger CCHC-type and RNA-binding motif-containing protein 1 [Portunus trituberculatus]|uniref:Zinc finger CCHC-type and RNA-binding motif-containing protein 1 n=1 Tax=Portunus trituberculatus TaxID=210409 RepID=A0A5B7FVZ5_PORTR|nr:Zinc finger CCHC-type and RNA-binding motif-containing protein 1 [Portunus trituberculatus]